MSEFFKNGNRVSEMLTNQEIMLSLSDAFNLLESDLYETVDAGETAMLATAMANVAQVLLEYRRTEEGAAEIARLRAIAENSANAPDYNGVEDMPPEDYNPDDESGDKPIYDGESVETFGGAET